jgi:hypothetical protein
MLFGVRAQHKTHEAISAAGDHHAFLPFNFQQKKRAGADLNARLDRDSAKIDTVVLTGCNRSRHDAGKIRGL